MSDNERNADDQSGTSNRRSLLLAQHSRWRPLGAGVGATADPDRAGASSQRRLAAPAERSRTSW